MRVRGAWLATRPADHGVDPVPAVEISDRVEDAFADFHVRGSDTLAPPVSERPDADLATIAPDHLLRGQIGARMLVVRGDHFLGTLRLPP